MPKTVRDECSTPAALLEKVRDPQSCGVEIDDGLARLLYPFAEREGFSVIGNRESVDSALTLIHRRLPCWRLERLMHNTAGRWYACLEHRNKVQHLLHLSVACEAPSAARALVAAFLKAIDCGA